MTFHWHYDVHLIWIIHNVSTQHPSKPFSSPRSPWGPWWHLTERHLDNITWGKWAAHDLPWLELGYSHPTGEGIPTGIPHHKGTTASATRTHPAAKGHPSSASRRGKIAMVPSQSSAAEDFQPKWRLGFTPFRPDGWLIFTDPSTRPWTSTIENFDRIHVASTIRFDVQNKHSSLDLQVVHGEHSKHDFQGVKNSPGFNKSSQSLIGYNPTSKTDPKS